MRNLRMVAFALAALLSACATTHITSTWKDPTASTTMVQKVLVVAMVPQEAVRRNLEQQLANDIRLHGPVAIPSMQYVQDVRDLKPKLVQEIVQNNHFDAVLVTQYVATRHELQYVPGPLNYEEYFGGMVPLIAEPGYYQDNREVQLQSRFYDAHPAGKLLWTATTSTTNPPSNQQLVVSASKKIVDRLRKDIRILAG